MSRLGATLERLIAEHFETATNFKTETGFDNTEASRIISGARKRVTVRRLRQLVKAFAKKGKRAQGELVAGFLADYLPDDFRDLVDITHAKARQSGQPVVLPRDEFDEAVETIRTFRNDAQLRAAVIINVAVWKGNSSAQHTPAAPSRN